jgi:hypothetical protein
MVTSSGKKQKYGYGWKRKKDYCFLRYDIRSLVDRCCNKVSQTGASVFRVEKNMEHGECDTDLGRQKW